MIAANNNFIVARRMTMTEITKAVAFVLFDLMLIGVFSQPGVPPPFVGLAWTVVYIYALLLAIDVYISAEHVAFGLGVGRQSRAYAISMTFCPMPPMILSCIAVGGILSLSIFSFYYGGWGGIIPSGLLIYAGITSAMIYTQRMGYHASIERRISHVRQVSSCNSNPQKNHVSGTRPYSGRMGENSRSDR